MCKILQYKKYSLSLHPEGCEAAHARSIASELTWLSLNRSFDRKFTLFAQRSTKHIVVEQVVFITILSLGCFHMR